MSSSGKSGSKASNPVKKASNSDTKSKTPSLKEKKIERKRHIFSPDEKQRVIEDALSKPGCVRLCRRMGVPRVDGSLYEGLRQQEPSKLENVLCKMMAFVAVAGRKTATDRDVKEALKAAKVLVVGYVNQKRGASKKPSTQPADKPVASKVEA